MREGSDWRAPTDGQDLADYDFADCAQEFVRRSPDCRQDYAQTHQSIAAQTSDPAPELEGLARRWGMIFPLFTHTQRQTIACTVAAQDFGLDAYSGCDPRYRGHGTAD